MALSSCGAIMGAVKKAPSMKIAASFLVFLTGIVHVYASAGPPPFTNGSPLVSGVDGFLPSHGARTESYRCIPLHLRQWRPDEQSTAPDRQHGSESLDRPL
jgi:hypothetical protein